MAIDNNAWGDPSSRLLKASNDYMNEKDKSLRLERLFHLALSYYHAMKYYHLTTSIPQKAPGDIRGFCGY